MLDLLNKIDEICKKNNLEYWLDSGSLLGAVRHKGFIPWDDDLDICMPRESYNKLLKLLEFENDKDYFLQTFKTDKFAELAYAKFRSRHNILKIRNDEKGHTGIFIDIFPVDIYSEDSLDFIKTKKRITYETFFFWMTKAEYKKFNLKNLKGNLVKFIAKTYFAINKNYDYSNLLTSVFKKAEKVDLFSGGNLTNYGIEVPFDLKMEKKDVFPLEIIEFENKQYYAPHNTDKYLKALYGNYMELPKEEDRIPSHCYEMKINISNDEYAKLNKSYWYEEK